MEPILSSSNFVSNQDTLRAGLQNLQTFACHLRHITLHFAPVLHFPDSKSASRNARVSLKCPALGRIRYLHSERASRLSCSQSASRRRNVHQAGLPGRCAITSLLCQRRIQELWPDHGVPGLSQWRKQWLCSTRDPGTCSSERQLSKPRSWNDSGEGCRYRRHAWNREWRSAEPSSEGCPVSVRDQGQSGNDPGRRGSVLYRQGNGCRQGVLPTGRSNGEQVRLRSELKLSKRKVDPRQRLCRGLLLGHRKERRKANTLLRQKGRSQESEDWKDTHGHRRRRLPFPYWTPT